MNRQLIYIVSITAFVVSWANNVCWANGWITVHTNAYKSEVVLDKEQIIPAKGKTIVLTTEAGKHSIMVTREGYRPYIDTITVADNTNHILNIWLEPTDEKYIRLTTAFVRKSWDYQITNNKFKIRWIGVGASIGSGANMHLSLLNMRYGLLAIDPCIWGFNAPFYNDLSHVSTRWQVRPPDRHSTSDDYEVARPEQGTQLYYTPMIGLHLPISSRLAVVFSAGPQISWTHIIWKHELRSLADIPSDVSYDYTRDALPTTGYFFDPVWFAIQAHVVITGQRSDLIGYMRYQDGIVVGLEMRF